MAKVSNRSLIKYHKFLGLFAALLAFVLSITGLLLQHTDTLELDKRYLKADWLLSWYSYPQPDIQRIQLEQHEILQVEDKLLMDGRLLEASQGELWGAADNGETLLIGSGEQLFWVNKEAWLIDTLEAPATQPAALASHQSDFLLLSEDGWFAADNELESWAPASPYAGPLLKPDPVSIQEVHLPAELAVGISWERLLLDLHSGRLFGAVGVVLMDLAALALVLLAFTGCWVWLRKR